MTPEEIAQAMSGQGDHRRAIAQRSRMRGLQHRERRLHQTIGGVLGYSCVVVGMAALAALASDKAGWGMRLGLLAIVVSYGAAGARLWWAREAELWLLAVPMTIVALGTLLFGVGALTLINGAGIAAVGFLGQVRGEIREERKRAEEGTLQQSGEPPNA